MKFYARASLVLATKMGRCSARGVEFCAILAAMLACSREEVEKMPKPGGRRWLSPIRLEILRMMVIMSRFELLLPRCRTLILLMTSPRCAARRMLEIYDRRRRLMIISSRCRCCRLPAIRAARQLLAEDAAHAEAERRDTADDAAEPPPLMLMLARPPHAEGHHAFCTILRRDTRGTTPNTSESQQAMIKA